jgi:hypothetical protein
LHALQLFGSVASSTGARRERVKEKRRQPPRTHAVRPKEEEIMADRAELMRLGKEELAELGTRLAARARRYKEKAKETAEQTMEFALAGGTAFGVGYYMGTIKRDPAHTEEDLKMFGVDRDLLIGVTLAGVGLTGMAGKRMSGAARAAGMGALAYWAGNYGEKIAMEAETA